MQEKNQISKSQKKRDMTALQKLGEALVRLSPSQLKKFDLEESLFEAIVEAKNLNSHGAIRRQLQYIGKLMRHVDAQPIQNRLDIILNKDSLNKARFHRIETLRSELLEGDQHTINSFCERYPKTDRKALTQAVVSAKEDPKKSKKLFQFISEIIDL